MPRIWFNRAYESAARVIEMLRANPDGRALQVVGTHTDPDSPVLRVCDESYPEPDIDAADYVEWALEFAREHGVDVLVPRVHLAELAAAKQRFAEGGTRLLCPDAATVLRFADKSLAYAAAAALGLPVPPYRVVDDAAGVRSAYAELAEVAERVCLKPTHGTNGSGYRILSTTSPALADFAGPAKIRADVDALCSALDDAEAAGDPRPRLLLMPHLTGPEISMDVLADAAGRPRAVIGRTRSRRRRLLVDDGPAREVAETLTAAHGISFLSNTQIRYWRGPSDPAPRPYLLDVNTRISGGLFQTALAGVNLPWAAIRLVLGEDPGPLAPEYGAAFTTTSALVPLPGIFDGPDGT